MCCWRAARRWQAPSCGPGAIDRILAYVAPILLGGPITAVDDVGVLSIAHAQRWRFDGMDPIGPDVLLSLKPA